MDNFSEFGWTVPLKNKKAQIIKDSFENILIASKSKPNLFETDRGKEFYNNIFQNLLINVKLFSRTTPLGAVFAERFRTFIRHLLEIPVFEKCDSNWIDVLPTKTKHCINRIHSSIKLTPIQAS